MNGSIFLTSFAATNCAGSKLRTSPAMRVGNVEASKLVIGPMPLLPAVMFAHAVATSLPTGLMMPRPVTTTRRLLMGFTSAIFHDRDSKSGRPGRTVHEKQNCAPRAQPWFRDWGQRSGLDVRLDVV